jgi:micrococcal nuclease
VPSLAKGPVSNGWRVSRIVDGDTVEVTRGQRALTLRLLGIDTPETVHPTEPIECFGPEASSYASRKLLRQPVALEFDRSQGRLDYYGRTLAYVWVKAGSKPWLFNRRAVSQGYANEYTYDSPYAWRLEFLRAEQRAKQGRRGLWRACH